MAQVLRGECDSALLDRAVVLTDELVQNAILYTSGDFKVTVAIAGDHVRIGVTDRCCDWPTVQRPDLEIGRGRGFMMINQMTSQWGVRSTRGGKTVWFELPLDWPKTGIVRQRLGRRPSRTGGVPAKRTRASAGAGR